MIRLHWFHRNGAFNVFALLSLALLASPDASAATQCINQNAPAPLEVCVQDSGRPAVWVQQPNGRTRQYYSDYSWGSVIWLNGTDTASRFGTGYQGGTTVSTVSNARTGTGTANDPWTITTITNLGSTGVQMTQVFRYVDGDRTLRKTFSLRNNGASTFNDLRFFHGGDTYFGGDDSARSWYDPANKMVYVTNQQFTNSGLMGFYANPATPASRYFSGQYNTGNNFAATTAQLPNTNDSVYRDAGYYLQWNRNTLSPGQTWTIDSYEMWSPPGPLQVLAPIDGYVAPGATANRLFRVHNLTANPLNVSFSAGISPAGWAVTMPGANSATIPALELADVPLEIAVPGGLSNGVIRDLSLTATSGAYTPSASTRLTTYTPDYTITPNPIDFGTVTINTTQDLTLTLSNGPSGLPVQISSVAEANGLRGPLSIVSDTCSDATVNANGSCTLTVRFAPTHIYQVLDNFSFPIVAPVLVNETINVLGNPGLIGYTATASAAANGSISPAEDTTGAGMQLAFTVTPNPGYRIDTVTGCSGSLNGNTFTTGAMNADCAINATFAVFNHSVSTSAGVGGSLSPGNATVADGATRNFTVTPSPGYSIGAVSGCGGSLNGSTYTTGAITGACTVSASFTRNSYFVTVLAGAGGSLSPGSAIVSHGDNASFTVAPDTGYSIDSVSGCGGSLNGNSYTTGTVVGACTVTAAFALNSYAVTASAGSDGSISPANSVVNHGDTTSFTLTPDAGYAVASVSGCGGSLSGGTYTTGAITGACSVEVSYARSAPIFTPSTPATYELDSTGLLTSLPQNFAPTAVDHLGAPLAVTLVGGKTEYAPGAYTLTWRAVDSRGIEATVDQVLHVWPIVSMGRDVAVGYTAGNSTSFRVALNGAAPVYPFTVNFTAAGHTQPTDLANDSVEFVNGETDKDYHFAVTTSAAAGMPAQRIDVALDPAQRNRGPRNAMAIALTVLNQPATVTVRGEQGGESRPVFARNAAQPFTLGALIEDPNSNDTHNVSWSAPAGAEITVSGGQIVVNPASLLPGVHRFRVTVTDNGSPTTTTTRDFDVVIANSPASLPVGSAGWAESGLPAHPDYSPATRNVLPERSGKLDGYLIEGEPGVQMALGSLALTQGQFQAQLAGATLAGMASDTVVNGGGVFDFEVRGLPEAGKATSVVVPLHAAIAADSVYRLYDPATGTWSSFVQGPNDSLASAPAVGGVCPPPGSSAWTPGLTTGATCVRVQISDGGPNDRDGKANGVIPNTGGVAAMNQVTVVASGRGKGGGGALDVLLLVFGAAVLALRYAARRRVLPLALVAAAMPLAANAEGFYVGGQWGRAEGDITDRDVNGKLAELGYLVTADFDGRSRNAWKVFGGYQVTRYVALEAGYNDFGDVRSSLSGPVIDVNELLEDVTRIHPHSASGYDFAVRGRFPFAGRFAATGRVGYLRWRSTYRAVNSEGREFARHTESGGDLGFGVGIEMNVSERWAVVVDWNRNEVDGEAIEVAGIGVRWRVN